MSQQNAQDHSVRRRGFQNLANPSDVFTYLASIPPIEQTERISVYRNQIESLAGRRIAEDVFSQVDIPSFPKAMMDGFAVCRKMIAKSNSFPVRLPVTETRTAGNCVLTDSILNAEGCVEIMTGSPVPSPMDLVIPFEEVEIHYKNDQPTEIAFNDISKLKANISPVGEDVTKGQKVFPAGHRIRPQDLGALASFQISDVEVFKLAQTGLYMSGDEIQSWEGQTDLPLGTTLDANGPVLAPLIERDSGLRPNTHFLPDCKKALTKAILDSEEEVLIFCGGTSAGIADHLPEIIRETGTLNFHGVNLRPGRPVGIGKVGSKQVFLLPGNPIACYFTYDLFVRPTLNRLSRHAETMPYKRMSGKVANDIPSKLGRIDYLRIKIENGSDDCRTFNPITTGRSSSLSTICEAEGFCLIPESDECWKKGKEVEAWIF